MLDSVFVVTVHFHSFDKGRDMYATKIAVFVVALFCIGVTGSEGMAQPKDRSLRVIRISGDGYQRGLMHGKQLKTEIAEVIAKWRKNTARTLRQDDVDKVLKDFFEYAEFEVAIKKWTPDLLEEVKGIADGSGQSFENIFVLNLLDEFWVYIDAPERHHCSALGIPALNGEPARVAQNMDLETYTDGYQVLIRVEGNEETPAQLLLTHAGLIALNGMNAARIGVCVNTLMELKASRTGLPVAFVVRGLLAQRDKDDALRFLQEDVDHASGQNYLIGIGDEVFDFEASANQVVQCKSGNKNGSLFHTNHCLANDDKKPRYDKSYPGLENCETRLDAVASRIESESDVRTKAIMAALRSKDSVKHPVCLSNKANRGVFTFASTIMILGENPKLLLTIGPPDEGDYAEFDLLSDRP